MIIYEVRFLNELGIGVGEFGFYEAKADAERRRAKVASLIKQRGTLEIREITPEPPSEFFERRAPRNDNFYEFK